jgi:hypothetical protein
MHTSGPRTPAERRISTTRSRLDSFCSRPVRHSATQPVANNKSKKQASSLFFHRAGIVSLTVEIPLFLMRLRWLIAVWASAGLGQQPVDFPHNRHVALGLACLDCHSTADARAAAGMPSVRKCMLCHEKLATDKPGVQRVIDYAAKKQEIPWRRVYGFSREASVQFRHAPHVRAKIDCTTCHGDMTQATVALRAVNHTMGTCLSCHRDRKAPEDCASCHY